MQQGPSVEWGAPADAALRWQGSPGFAEAFLYVGSMG
jgi:hypothetical protein